mgnify:CR=1 FL=1
MSDRVPAPGRRSPVDVPVPVLVGLALLATVIAWIGWTLVLSPGDTGWSRHEEALYRALAVNTLSELYSGSELAAYREAGIGWHLLILARWLGTAFFALTLAKVVIHFFWQAILTALARLIYTDHVVVFGDTPFADKVAEEAARQGLRVVHFLPDGREIVRDGVLTLSSDVPLVRQLSMSGAHRARSLVFALPDGAESADLARDVFFDARFEARARRAGGRGRLAASPRFGPHLHVMMDDAWFDQREALDYAFHKRQGTEGTLDSVVELLSESRCAARAVLAKHPVFRLREGEPQHILLLGFGAMAEALLQEVCETQRTDADRKQAVTILDPDPATWRRFVQRCPAWEQAFDGQFFEGTLDTIASDPDAFLARLGERPLTAAYSVTGTGADPMLEAAKLKTFLADQVEAGALPDRGFGCPIFACVRGGGGGLDGTGDWRQTGTQGAAPRHRLPIVPFGTWRDIVAASRVLEAEPDLAAFQVHATHARLYAGAALTNWSQVPEVARHSSRSAAAYLPALLHAAGYDLGPWLATAAPYPPSVNAPPNLPPGRVLAGSASVAVYLARLEHLRWCAERILSGFQRGEKDLDRKRHPRLVPFDALPVSDQAYNIRYIQGLGETLLPDSGTCILPDRAGAKRILMRPTDLALLEAAGLEPASEVPPPAAMRVEEMTDA